eukprot:c26297_g1_i1 orf=870-2744(-)
MPYPFRHDANAKESVLNSSTSNLLDLGSSSRPLTPFSTLSDSTPVFQHAGSAQGFHNAPGSYNMLGMPTTLSSRNSGLGSVPSGVHQSSGTALSAGRFTSNNLPVGLSQLSHGGLHGHTGMTSRGGISVGGSHSFSSSMNGVGASVPGGLAGSGAVNSRGIPGLGVSPSIIGSAGPRITSSVGSVVGAAVGTGINRTNNSGTSVNSPSFNGSHVSLGAISGSGGLGVQGPGRPLSTVLQQASLRKQGVNSIVQQSQEFSIQNEDFPALPGFKGGSSDFATQLHQKEQQQDSAISLMQPQHLTMGRSAGFTLGGSYSSQRQQQQLPQVLGGKSTSLTSGSFASAGSIDLLHLHGSASDIFQTSHGLSSSNHAQVQAGSSSGGASSQTVISNLRSGGPPNTNPILGTYDQLVHQYQHHQNQLQFRLGAHQQQISAVGQFFREPGLKLFEGIQGAPDRFGLLGLLSVIRMSDRDLTTLALGTDLTTLGLNLNSRDNLYKTFASPWAEGPTNVEPEFTLPHCYIQQAPRLQPGYFSKFQQDTLFHIFYSMPNDEAQLYAANELCNRGWFYHKEHCMWFTRIPNVEPLVKTNTYERGCYFYFDPSVWETGRKDNFVLYYEMVENRPKLP